MEKHTFTSCNEPAYFHSNRLSLTNFLDRKKKLYVLEHWLEMLK